MNTNFAGIYFTAFNSIDGKESVFKTNAEGSSLETIYSLSHIRAINVDKNGGYIYIVQKDPLLGTKIRRIDNDGSNPMLIGSLGFQDVTCIQVDSVVSDKIFLGGQTTNVTRSFNLDLTGSTTIIPLPSGASNDLDLDFYNNHLYCAVNLNDVGNTNGAVLRVDTDGSNLIKIYNPSSSSGCWGVSVDPKQQKIYSLFRNAISGPDQVVRFDYDGSNAEVLAEISQGNINEDLSLDIFSKNWVDVNFDALFGTEGVYVTNGNGLRNRILDSGDFSLLSTSFYNVDVISPDAVSLSICGSGPSSGNLDLSVCGIVPKPALSCPVVQTTGSIVITQELVDIFQGRIDAMINQLGKNVTLIFDADREVCPNCEFDPIRKRSSGRPKAGGPRPFIRGRTCPYCKGKGFVESQNQKCIKALTRWNPKDAIQYGISVRRNKDIVRLKTFTSDYDDLIRAKYALANADIASVDRFMVRLKQAPVVTGLRESRYCISFWERV